MDQTLLDDPRLTALGLLIEAHDGLMRRLAPQLSQGGVPQHEFEALLRLARSPGSRLRMSDLASQLSLSTSGLTRMTDRLAQRGLVTRERCESDRRGYYVVLTEAGLALVTSFIAGHLALIDEWFTGLLDPAELDALTSALRKVRDVVHPGAEAGTDCADVAAAVERATRT